MGRAHHLKQTLPKNLSDSVDWSRPEAVEFVVWTYSSPDDLAEWMTTDPRLQPYLDAGILKFASCEGTVSDHSHAKNMAHALAPKSPLRALLPSPKSRGAMIPGRFGRRRLNRRPGPRAGGSFIRFGWH